MGILKYSKVVKGASFTGHVFVDISTDAFRTKAASVKVGSWWSTEGGYQDEKILIHSSTNHLKANSELGFGKTKYSLNSSFT